MEFCEFNCGAHRSGACPRDGLFEVDFLVAYVESPLVEGYPCIFVVGSDESKEGFVDVGVLFKADVWEDACGAYWIAVSHVNEAVHGGFGWL